MRQPAPHHAIHHAILRARHPAARPSITATTAHPGQASAVQRLLGSLAVLSGALLLGATPAPLHAQSPAASGPGAPAAGASAPYRAANWDELMPKDWDPVKLLKPKAGSLREGDPAERAAIKAMREIWDAAPTRPELNGSALRLPGYVVPLEQVQGQVKEFLLVPYYGACVHSPPPPANQIIHVVLPKPQPLRSMDAVWASGTLSTQRGDSEWGVSGYRMDGQRVEPYHRVPGAAR